MKILRNFGLIAFILLVIHERGVAQQSRVDSILDAFQAKPQTVLVAAHRGAHQYFPENSLAAMGAAIKAGAHILELDVRETSDGKLVVMHDKTVDRTTTGSGEVASMTYQQLQGLVLTHQEKPTEYRIPTFREALLRCKDSILVDIDFKADGYEAAAHVCQVVAELGMEEQVLFFLYDYREMPRLHALNPRIKIMPRAYDPAELKAVLDMGIAKVIHIDEHFYQDELIAPLTHRGIRVWANTLGRYDQRAHGRKGYKSFFKKMQYVNVVQTDEPALLVEYLRNNPPYGF